MFAFVEVDEEGEVTATGVVGSLIYAILVYIYLAKRKSENLIFFVMRTPFSANLPAPDYVYQY